MLVNSWLDKVLKVSDINSVLSEYTYFNSGQLANATHNPVAGDNNAMTNETFVWDGLALIDRNGTSYINEPHAGGGNPVLAINGVGNTQAIFNDVLGTSVGNVSGSGYSAIEKTTFGYNETNNTATTETNFYTGKPNVRNLGYVFLMRNYRSDLSKWQTEDPTGYPDGWNNFAYCNNQSTMGIDLYGMWLPGSHHDINEYITNGSNPTWGGVEQNYTDILNDASDYTDNEKGDVLYMHAMRGPNQNDESAKSQWNSFISDSISKAKKTSDKAREEESLEILEDALFELGMAIHAYADSFSPSHKDFQIWYGRDESWEWTDYEIDHFYAETAFVYRLEKHKFIAKIKGRFNSAYQYIIKDDQE